VRFVVKDYFAVTDLSVFLDVSEIDGETRVVACNVLMPWNRHPHSLPNPCVQSGCRWGSFISAGYSISFPVTGWTTVLDWCCCDQWLCPRAMVMWAVSIPQKSTWDKLGERDSMSEWCDKYSHSRIPPVCTHTDARTNPSAQRATQLRSVLARVYAVSIQNQITNTVP
jgi:hypothetical protein